MVIIIKKLKEKKGMFKGMFMKKILFLFLAVFAVFALAACETDKDDKEIEKLEIVTQVTKKDYNLGEELDLAGLEVKAI